MPLSPHRSLHRLALCLCVLGFSAAAHAASPKAEADALLQQGVKQRAAGQDEQALTLFQRAVELAPTPKAIAQLALCEQALGQWVAAETHLQQALASPADPWIKKNRSQLEGAAERIASELGWLELSQLPADAALSVDGESVPTPDGPLRLPTGTRTLRVQAEGHEPYSRQIAIHSGETTRERVALVRTPVATETPAAAPITQPPSSATTKGGSGVRTAGWIGVGVGVAAAAFGGVALGLRGREVNRYNDDPSCPGTAAGSQPAQCASAQSAASNWTTASIVSLAAGGALLTTGVVLLMLPSGKKRTEPIAIQCGQFGVGAQCMGTF